jgi:hypothetical protein
MIQKYRIANIGYTKATMKKATIMLEQTAQKTIQNN